MYILPWSVCTTRAWSRERVLAEVLEVMNEVRQAPTLVNFVAGRHDALRQGTRPAAEHSYFANLRNATQGVTFRNTCI